ncbi:MAG: hypothetical protein HQ534_14505 [Armatimonadetes bacterium]|nr:hypothetical protein [Armatimonadota bacterium]
MYLLKNVVVPISMKIDLKYQMSKKLKLPLNSINNFKVIQRSIDARKKNNLKFNYTILTELPSKYLKNPDVLEYKYPEPYIQTHRKLSSKNPFIIGAGPAGLFAALALVEKGFQSYIFERGDKIEDRIKRVSDFWQKGILDEESNVQFGEGGAGTFSDGKLTSRKSDYYTNQVTKYLIQFGADQKISYEALPHLGTDTIRDIVLNIRKYLEEKGCKFFWRNKLENLNIENDKITSVRINGKEYKPEIIILAIGNSARDTFEMLSQKTEMESKPFAVGFRIEHSQDFINEAFYGEKTDFTITGPASYRLTAQDGKKGIYSFCMCPGGFVIPASSEKDGLVLNGMSFLKRDNKFANAAIVVTVNEVDFGQGILAGMKFQRKIEKKCFQSDHPYVAPAQKGLDFMNNNTNDSLSETSYKPGIIFKDLNNILPSNIIKALITGLNSFEKRISGFANKGILLAPETRTSSPVRILRDKVTFESATISNLYPIGEGSGYAGGIMSSAADGFKVGSVFAYKP